MILLPDVLQALTKTATEGLAKLAYFRGRIYGFISPETKLSAREQIWLSRICGPRIFRHSPELLDVQVLWLEPPSCKKIDENLPALDFKRQAIWHNERRNGYIASVAKAFAEQDRAKLRKYNAPYPYTPVGYDRPRDALVTILVESTEHGKELLKRLVGWQLIDAVPREIKPSIDQNAQGYIYTQVAAKKFGLSADVVIRATGLTGAVDFSDFPMKRGADIQPDSVFVDFTDTFSKKLSLDAQHRKKDYQRRGWWDAVQAK